MRKLLLGLIGLLFAMPAVATDLPSGYTELEYIESTGTQYIDTGITGFNTGDWEIYAKWLLPVATQTNSYANVFSAYSSENHNSYRIITKLTDSSAYYVSGNSKAGGGSVALDNKAINQIHTATARNGSVIFDGETINTPTQGTALPSDVNLGIFARGDASAKIVARIYSVNVKKDGVLIGDFVPAKNSSGVIGMYDTVSGNFFTNAGTGEFIAGPVVPEKPIKIATTAYNSARFNPVVTELNDTIATIRSVVTNTINQTKAIADLQATKQTRPNEQCPAGKKCLLVEDNDGQPHWYEIIENAYGLPNGYTGLEYIQGDKSAYIKSGITLDNNSSVEAKFQFPNTESSSSGNFICGARNSGPQNAFTLVGFSGGSYWASNYNNSGDTFGHADTNIHIIKRDKEKVYFDGSLVLTSTSATFTTPGEAYVFSINQGGAPFLTSNIKLWYLKMWDNGTLVRDFVPAKRISDNVVGMYDTVSGTFFTNAGTGTFTAGPEI